MPMFHLDSGYDMSDLFHHIISEWGEEKKKIIVEVEILWDHVPVLILNMYLTTLSIKIKEFKNFKKALF